MASEASATPQRLADEVYRRLREDIVTGRLRPRDLLVEVDLAERLAVSRTPIRESLHRLAADGLITSHRRRWVVHEHSPAEIAEIYEVRMALEGLAARLAAQRADDDQRAALRRLLQTPPPITTEAGNEWFVPLNAAFHAQVTEAARNAHLARLIELNRLYTFNRSVAARYGADEVAASQAEHASILDAIEAGDGALAEQLARTHVGNALGLIVGRAAK